MACVVASVHVMVKAEYSRDAVSSHLKYEVSK